MVRQHKRGHSEESFNAERDHWYNRDFLDLMARRWNLQHGESLLDVGAGMCHWSKLLASYLRPGASITALDSDPKWSRGSTQLHDWFASRDIAIQFKKGNAYKLPFEDDTFDIVTCQTLLLHLKHPDKALVEMKRVVKKGGIVICVEPNNRVQAIIQDSNNHGDDIDIVLERLRQSLRYEKQKINDSNGNNSFGDLLTGTMNALGFSEIQSYLNDKLISIYPPYNSPEQQAAINTFLTWGQPEEYCEDFDRRYRRAISGRGYLFFLKEYHGPFNDHKILDALRKQTYTYSGASLLYMISGKK